MLTTWQASSSMTPLVFAPELVEDRHLRDKSHLPESLLRKKKALHEITLFPIESRNKGRSLNKSYGEGPHEDLHRGASMEKDCKEGTELLVQFL